MSEQIIKALKDIKDKCGEDIFNDINRFRGAIRDILPGSEREIKRIRKRLIETAELGAYNNLKQAAAKNEIQIECSQLVIVLCDEGIDSVVAQDVIQSFAALFTTEEIFIQQPQQFTDPRDGKVYKTVKIGKQVWMAENLNFDCPGSKCYDNDPENAEKYGRLYDWETANKVCPPGWHLPDYEEWQTLVDFAGGNEDAGKKLKAKNGWDWKDNGTDEFGFSALPGGESKSDGSFSSFLGGVGSRGNWWSASECNSILAFIRIIYCDHDNATRCLGNKGSLLSVRCLQDYPKPIYKKQLQQFTDSRDGKVYKTVKIGNQIWMAENLNFDCPGSWCYENNPENAEKYGRLYDWDTAKKSCPPGWHLPNYEEWQTLVDFAGGNEIAGKKLKAENGWGDDQEKSGYGTDDFGFSALPGGLGSSYSRLYYEVGECGYWWSAEENKGSSSYAYFRWLLDKGVGVFRHDKRKSYLLSVRYIRD